MKGILQYSSTSDGPWLNVLTIRTRKNQKFQINDLTIKNRLDIEEVIGYEVTVEAQGLSLNETFLNYAAWYFRIVYYDEGEYIYLGNRNYKIRYDGKIELHEIVYINVSLQFLIDIDEFGDYTNLETLPISEGGIYVEDDDIYIS